MINSSTLLNDLKQFVKRLEDDLRGRCNALPEVDRPLRVAYEAAKIRKRTAKTYAAWRDEELTQVAVAWVLACVFVRFLEDIELIEVPVLAGPGARLQRAKDEHEIFFRAHPTLTEREYFEQAFTEVGKLPAMKEFFDRRHNPLWKVAPSGDAAKELLDFWRRTDPETGTLRHDFTDPEWNTRFLGDLYQDLSEAAKKTFALLQTPEFIESFILDRTLTPAIQAFGYQVVRMIDPTCGSGHFLLGGFERLFRLWQQQQPGENPRVLAQKALDAVCGIDLNPYAVAIARFRLLLAALRVCDVRRLKDAPDFRVEVTVGDSLLHGRRFRDGELAGSNTFQPTFDTEDDFRDEIKHHYEVEDDEALHRILGRQYHAVVGNPPYITVKDKALSELYRERYKSCHRKYSLSVPFMERFFDLAVKGDGTPQQPAGFVGQITANSFMKREFGKKLIEEFLPRWDLTHVLDTSGAYIPGHGTPTVILFGKNQLPVNAAIRTVLGIAGEPATPNDPTQGLVWQAINLQIDNVGSVSEWVSAADSPRASFHKHPWSIGGGGLAELKEQLEEQAEKRLDEIATAFGVMAVAGEDDIYFSSDAFTWNRRNVRDCIQPLAIGEFIRDFRVTDTEFALYPHDHTGRFINCQSAEMYLWNFRTPLRSGIYFGQTKEERGYDWRTFAIIVKDKLHHPRSITFPAVSTHNHFAFSRGGLIFNRTSPIIKLPKDADDDLHLELTAQLNSSFAAFWMKQVFTPKGGDHVGTKGARVRKTLWDERYDIDSSKLKSFPVASIRNVVLATTLDSSAKKLLMTSPSTTVASWGGPASEGLSPRLGNARVESSCLQCQMIALQEELDWQIYEAFGLVESTDQVSLPEGAAMDALPPDGIELGQRAFEIVLARRMAAGEVQTTWFVRHGSTPITEIPATWPAAYRELVERRINRIETDANIRLIEQPEYKRRWNTEPWDEQLKRALQQWLLLRLETYFFESQRMVRDNLEFGIGNEELKSAASGSAASTSSSILHLSSFAASSGPHLASTNQLAEAVQSDAAFLEVAEIYHGSTGFSVAKLVQELVEAESVPNLPVHRYKDTGLRKRKDWEHVWELQRREDEVETGVRIAETEKIEEELKKLIRKAQLEKVGEVPIPPKYASADFKKASFWKLRGKLDVPKERWIVYPGAERDGDPSPLIAWAGWNHLQQAQALAEYFLDAKQNQGWPPEKLRLLLAGLLDLLPWLKQWHNDPDPDYGMGLGDYFDGFLNEECRGLSTTVEELNGIRTHAEPQGRRE